MEIVNLTPHEITVWNKGGALDIRKRLASYPINDDRSFARVDYDDTWVGTWVGGESELLGGQNQLPIWNINNERVRIYTLNDPSMNRDSATHKTGLLLGVETDMFSEWPKSMPEERQGVYYIVSCRVAGVLSNRDDILVPYGIIKNSDGEIIGCKGFTNQCGKTRKCGVVY